MCITTLKVEAETSCETFVINHRLHDVVSYTAVIFKFMKVRGVTPCRYRQYYHANRDIIREHGTSTRTDHPSVRGI
jgi:hypothetical protein